MFMVGTAVSFVAPVADEEGPFTQGHLHGEGPPRMPLGGWGVDPVYSHESCRDRRVAVDAKPGIGVGAVDRLMEIRPPRRLKAVDSFIGAKLEMDMPTVAIKHPTRIGSLQ